MDYHGILDFNYPKNLQKNITLLEAVRSEGSISKAAKKIPISYKNAWEIIDNINNLSNQPIVTKAVGGSGGGGTRLTKYGEELIENYYLLKSEYDRFLKNISSIKDISNLKKMALKISARNQLFGKIVEIKTDKASSEIKFELKSGVVLKSIITKEAQKELELDVDDEIVGIIKASSVLISNKKDFKRNSNIFEGFVEFIERGESVSNIKLHINNADTVRLSLKNRRVKELSLKEGQKVFIFIRPKDILIGK